MGDWNTLFFGVVANLALLISLTFLYGLLLRKLQRFSSNRQAINQGILFGAIAIIALQMPIYHSDGITIDSRVTIVMLAGAFAGPLAGLIAAAIVCVFSLYPGADGSAAELGAILTSAVIGGMFRAGSRVQPGKVRSRHLLLIATPVTVFFLLWIAVLPIGEESLEAAYRVLLPAGIWYPATALILGLMLAQEYRRQQLMQKVRESENRLRRFSDVASDWMWETDADLRFTYVSERVLEVTGVRASWYIGKTREDVAGDSAATEKWQRHFQDLRERRSFKGFSYERMGPGDKIQYLSISGTPVIDEAGYFQGYIGVGWDRTGQIEAEERARIANERLAAAIEALGEPFALWDAEDRLVIGNKKFRDINTSIGHLRDSGTHYPDFLKALVDHKLVPQAIGQEAEWIAERTKNFLNPGESFEQLRPDGTWLMIHDQSLPDGSTATISTDITRMKQTEKRLAESQARFRDFANAAADWYWEQDKDLRFVDVSEESVEIKLLNVKEHIGKTRRETNIQDVTEAELQVHEALLEARQPFSDFQFSRQKPDGSKLHISISGQPFYDSEGNFSGYRGAGQDITELKDVNEKLRGAQRMEAVGQLTGGIAHDFNNLMAVMVGNAELLELNIDSGEDVKQNIDAIKNAAARGASQTHRLLAFSRQQPLSPVASDINELISGLAEIFRRTLGTDIELKVETTPGLWPATIDPHQFEDALLNLAINAQHAMPKGGALVIRTGNITLDNDFPGLSEEITPGDFVEVNVTDTGTGIPASVLEKVFEPFFTTKEVGEGSGLGLSMVYGFVRQSSGHVTAVSEVGEGANFCLYLPRAMENS